MKEERKRKIASTLAKTQIILILIAVVLIVITLITISLGMNGKIGKQRQPELVYDEATGQEIITYIK